MKKKRTGLIIFLVILLIAGIVAGIIFIPKLFGSSKSSGMKMPQINTVKLEKKDLTESVSATGTIESAKTTTVSADVQSITVKKVLVEVGDTVTEGQKLVTFDKSELKSALKDAEDSYNDTASSTSSEVSQAYRQLSEARSNYYTEKKKMEQNVKDAKAALDKAKKRAKKSSKASVASTGEGVPVDFNPGTGTSGGSGTGSGNTGNIGGGTQTGTSAQTVTISDNMTVAEAKAAYKQAKENLESVNKQNRQAITSAEQAVSQAQNSRKQQLRQAKKSVQDAEETLKSAAITATMDGTVTALGVEDGSTYNGGDAVEISDLTSFQVSTTVDEYDITKIEKGQRVVILTDATGDEEIEGEITFVALTAGSSTLSSGNGTNGANMNGAAMGSSSSSSSGYEITISLNKTDLNIRSGMTAKCSIIIKEAADVFAVPYDAITTDDNGKSTITVLDSSKQSKEIEVVKGMESDYYVEVSSSELSEDMSVIIPSDTPSTDTSDSDSSEGFGSFFGGGAPGGMSGPPDGVSFPGGGSGSFPGGPPGQ